MKIIGLTGGIASGKSLVSNILRQTGWPIIDADQVTRQLQEPGAVGLKKIAAYFGQQMIKDDGNLNRAKLGRQVFAHPKERAQLNQIMQPLIRERVAEQLQQFQRQQVPYVVLDFPLLFEAHYAEDCDLIVVVAVRPAVQLQRLMERNGYSKQEALNRINAQLPLAEKVAQADVIIDNNGSKETTKQQVATLVDKLTNNQLC